MITTLTANYSNSLFIFLCVYVILFPFTVIKLSLEKKIYKSVLIAKYFQHT